MAGFRPGFGRGGTIHSFWTGPDGVDAGPITDSTEPFIEDGARGSNARGTSATGEEAFDETDIASLLLIYNQR